MAQRSLAAADFVGDRLHRGNYLIDVLQTLPAHHQAPAVRLRTTYRPPDRPLLSTTTNSSRSSASPIWHFEASVVQGVLISVEARLVRLLFAFALRTFEVR
jgi:hypothetical protein